MSKTFFFQMCHLFKGESVNLVNAYGLNGNGEQAIKLFNRIASEIITESTYVCVLNVCSHSGLIEEGEMIFKMIPQEKRTKQIYTSMVSDVSSLFKFLCFHL